ncbi:MAG: DMT family transporter [Gammaproteobacteria bacterium]|nr:DMT family transporter [Gammaproteobacteria bacterium]
MSAYPQNGPLTGILLVVFGSIAFSSKAIMIKLAYAAGMNLDAITLMTLRMSFALPFYLGMLWWLRKSTSHTPLTRHEKLLLIAIGTSGYYLASLFDFWGLEYISASLERLILYLYPTMVILLSAALGRRRPTRTQVLALSVSYLGIALVVASDFQSGGHDVSLGSMLVFASALSYALFLIGNGKLVGVMGSRRFTAWSMLIATSGVFLHFVIRADFAALQQPIVVYGWGLALGLVSTVAASFMLNAGLRRLGAETTVLLSMVGPVSTLALGALVLDERLVPIQWLGAALVLAGVVITGYPMARKSPLRKTGHSG